MDIFFRRIIRAMRLEPGLYEEVEADRDATGQAAGVVVLSSIVSGIGYGGHLGIKTIFFGTLGALVGWMAWAVITYFVGTKILPSPQTRSDPGELLRTLGFAHSPAFLNIFGIIPLLGWLVRVIIFFWILFAWVIAVRQALDYTSTGRAVGVCVIGWLIYIVIAWLLTLFFGGVPLASQVL
jgi:hypothetical protein